LNVYDKYLFILQEKERIEAFLQKEPFAIPEFIAEILTYNQTIIKIREEMPFEIRMNMFLIRCGDINTLLCEECENLIDIILNKVGDFVFVRTAPDISQSVKTIQEELQ
jgi:hypothetical protein